MRFFSSSLHVTVLFYFFVSMLIVSCAIFTLSTMMLVAWTYGDIPVHLLSMNFLRTLGVATPCSLILAVGWNRIYAKN